MRRDYDVYFFFLGGGGEGVVFFFCFWLFVRIILTAAALGVD